jgi:hypothetical protein
VIRVRIRGLKYRTKYRNPVNQLTARSTVVAKRRGHKEQVAGFDIEHSSTLSPSLSRDGMVENFVRLVVGFPAT